MTHSGGGMTSGSTSRSQGESMPCWAVQRLEGSSSSMWSIRSRASRGTLKHAATSSAYPLTVSSSTTSCAHNSFFACVGDGEELLPFNVPSTPHQKPTTHWLSAPGIPAALTIFVCVWVGVQWPVGRQGDNYYTTPHQKPTKTTNYTWTDRHKTIRPIQERKDSNMCNWCMHLWLLPLTGW